MAFSIKIGSTDITNWIAYQGLKWSRNDVEAPDAGRTLDGLMHRGRVSTKIRLDITCVPLKDSDHRTLMNLILPETIQVTYTDPMYGTVTRTMYSNNNSSQYMMKKVYGNTVIEYWDNVQFALIEV